MIISLIFIGICAFGITQENDAVDNINGLGMYEFGSSPEHCECLDGVNEMINPCEKFPKNLFSYGYQVAMIEMSFSEKTDKLNTVSIYFDGNSQVKRDYIFKEMKKKYGEAILSDEKGDSWIGKKKTVFISKGKELYISYLHHGKELE